MTAGGYEFVTDNGPDRGLMFARADGDRRAVHVHLLHADDPEWARYIRFRDLLREHPEHREEYLTLKRTLALRCANYRAAYADAKTDFVTDVLRRANSETY